MADIEYFERMRGEEGRGMGRPSVGVVRLFDALFRAIVDGDKRRAEEYFELIWARVWDRGIDGN